MHQEVTKETHLEPKGKEDLGRIVDLAMVYGLHTFMQNQLCEGESCTGRI